MGGTATDGGKGGGQYSQAGEKYRGGSSGELGAGGGGGSQWPSYHSYVEFNNVSIIGWYGGGGSSADTSGCVPGAGGNDLSFYLTNIDPYALILKTGGSSYTKGCFTGYMEDTLYNILVEHGDVGTSIDESRPGTYP